jgi:hypothetical protein
MKIEEACKIRKIRKFDIETPILAPSFSSVVRDDIEDVFLGVKEQIWDYSLVSAYDLFYNKIKITELWNSKCVFIDSGKYETDELSNSINLNEWSKSKHRTVLDSLIPDTDYVIVSYDTNTNISEQIASAKELFKNYSKYANCFLYKSEDKKIKKINISEYIKNIKKMYDFDILGFTEKELGPSTLEKCKNIIKIRNGLNEIGYNHPIHIFGCLDPLSIIIYFLCGADIFDGTSWLKYSFHNDMALYFNNYTVLKGGWEENFGLVRKNSSINNIRELQNLKLRLIYFIQKRDFKALKLNIELISSIKYLIGTAGIENINLGE